MEPEPAALPKMSPVPAPSLAPVAPARWPVAILGVPIDPVTMDEALDRVEGMIRSGRTHYVVTPNVDFLVQARRDQELHRILLDADLVLCDGQPLVWASRWLGNPLPERVAGADLAPRLIERAARKGYRLFLLGATVEANERAVERLHEMHPDLQIAGHYAPPFRPLADMDHDEIRRRVQEARPDILFVSFGCPKQEKWISMHYQSLGVPVCLGVGATIDFIAGMVRRAPPWMRRSGLEWSYRLIQEPRRLFHRYATDLRYFGGALFAQWWSLRPRHHRVPDGAIEVTRVVPPWQDISARGAFDRPALERAAEVWHRIEEGEYDCHLDLAGVDFIDSTGAAALAMWRKRLRRAGHRLVLVHPSPLVQRLLQRSGLTPFEVSESIGGEEAA